MSFLKEPVGRHQETPRPDALRASTPRRRRVNVTGPLREIFNRDWDGLATGPCLVWMLEAEFLVDVADVALPLAMVAIEHLFGERLAARHNVTQRIEEAALIVSGSIELRPLAQA